MDLQTFLRVHWDRVSAWVLVAVGVIMLVIGWFGVADQPYPAGQIPYVISAGLGGVVAVGIGATLWLSADLRDEWRKMNALEATLRRVIDEPDSAPAPTQTPEPEATDLASAVRTRRSRRASSSAVAR